MSAATAWIFLLLAGLLEVSWVLGLKYSNGFTRPIPMIITVISLAGSMYFLSKATQVLPMGTAYGVWVGIGALGAAVFGIVLFHESASLMRIAFIGLLLVSIVGLKITS